ncbi:hypothetical protein [Cryptosporangium minutisporangium]|uniref:Uncharacterized protein n=1 Tax=Cryptosporangium minutisporangium TaxID=113569 RepID=A0ABP6SQY8_9ACTN
MEPEPAPTHTGPPLERSAPRTLLEALTPPAAPSPPVGTHLGTLVRPDDQVRLRIDLVNGAIDAAGGTIVATVAGRPIRLVLTFGPQHTVEATIAATDTLPAAAQGQRQAAPSRISLTVPDGTPFTVATLLDLAAFALHLDGRADGGTNSAEPTADVTAIEVPTSLVLSPTGRGPAKGRFTAATTPVTHDDVTELWRARLGVFDGTAVVEPPAALPAVRAIWSRPGDPPFTRPVDEDQRALLVEQTTGPGSEPITVSQLALSSHGAFADLDGAWATGVLAAYQQRVVTGRDVHVEVVERGYLAPWGLRATLTTLTERVFEPDAAGDTTAALVQDVYLAISEPTTDYPQEFMPFEGRKLPFLSVTAADPGSGPVGKDRIVLPNGSSINRDKACVLTRDGADLALTCTATDRTGRASVTFSLPAVFVADSEAYEAAETVGGERTVLAKLATWYGAADEPARQELALGGQAVGWATPSPDGEAGSVQTTNRIRLALDRPDLTDTTAAAVEARLRELGRPAFYPAVDAAFIVDVASATTLGGDPPETEVTVAQRWLDSGLEPDNVDLGYLDLATPTVLTPTIEATGMMSAALNVDTYGQRRGAGTAPVGGGRSWDPLDALAGLPKLLGNLALAELVGRVDDVADELQAKGLPTLRVEVRPGAELDDPPVGVCFHFTWEPTLKSFPAEGDEPRTFVVTADFEDEDALKDLPKPFGGDETHARLALTTCLPENSTSFEATLERFAIQLPPSIPPLVPVVAILFDQVKFTTTNGSSNVDTDIADWLFIGPLNWLEPIKDFVTEVLGLGAATFDGGIFVKYGIPIPGLTLGVLTVDGLRLDLGIDLPDSGASSIDFAMCTRDDPFTITIMGFGGNGSFGLEVDASKIVLIEGSMAVTYALAVDMFIASAALSASLGVFVLYEDDEVTLGAYAELRGSVSVLGLFEVSGKVTVGLLYNVTTQILRGVAAVTGEVSSPFGKKEVTHDVEVEVAVGNGNGAARRLGAAAPGDTALSFADHYSQPEWTAYCSAFAA